MKFRKKRALVMLAGNLSTTPRAHKFIKAFADIFDFELLTVKRDPKWEPFDSQLLQPGNRLHYVKIRREDDNQNWLLAKCVETAAKICNTLCPSNLKAAAYVSSKVAYLVLHHSGLLKGNYDVVFSFSYAAIYPAYRFAQKQGIPFICDIEDYHPGEIHSAVPDKEKGRREHLLRNILPEAYAVTAASPLIGAEVEMLAGIKVQYISNSFYSTEFRFEKPPVQDELKFIWFSQNINHGRGLEPFIRQLDQLQGRYSLTLIGNLHQAFAQEWIQSRPYIRVLQPMEQAALHHELAKYDVGLALELRSTDYNREIALTNKMFAYLQAGLFVVATDTKAQKLLLQEYPEHGLISEQTEEGLTKSIIFVLDHLAMIREKKEKRFRSAFNLAFEREGQKLLALWDGLVSKEHYEESNHRNTPFPSF